MSVKLRAVGPGDIRENFVFDLCAGHAPEISQMLLSIATTGSGFPSGVDACDPVDVLGKVTDLVKRIPDWQLHPAVVGARLQFDRDVRQSAPVLVQVKWCSAVRGSC